MAGPSGQQERACIDRAIFPTSVLRHIVLLSQGKILLYCHVTDLQASAVLRPGPLVLIKVPACSMSLTCTLSVLALLLQVAVVRVLQQLSQVYTVMTIPALQDLVPFMRFDEVEKLIVEAVKFDYLQVQIDHRNGTVHFGAQQLESEVMRDHLSVLAARLSKALGMIDPAPDPKRAARAAEVPAQALGLLH